jgi:crotonobetainyl-CoA:carnitine CoA-transferase CaiB-like acyl-CoA transferase
MVVEVDHPTLGRIKALGSPIKMSDTPVDVRRRAPLLGEHTIEVLREAGFDDREIDELRRSKAVGPG